LNFLNKFDSNIYVSQGTIFKVLDIDILLEVFASFPDKGFILSIKKELLINIETYPNNLLLLDWVPQNDLLGHHKVKVFITHGGINSILESLYHAKPMIVVGTTIDQVNGAVVVDYRKLGKGISKNSDLTKENLIAYISELLSNPVYTENCKFAQKLVKEKPGKETFYYWLNYTLEFGYEHLLIPAYSEYNFIELYNVDIIFLLVCLVALLFCMVNWSLKKLYMKIFTKNVFVSEKKKED
jgi:UDP:flavonoid glycosyltransferase YjiC (YdhE family)